MLFPLGACSVKATGDDGCRRDTYEPNDDPSHAYDLGDMQDDPDSRKDVDATLDTPTDEDWYRVFVKDTGLGGDPVVHVTTNPGYEITAWFSCANSKTDCQEGTSSTEHPELGQACVGDPHPNGAANPVMSMTTDCRNTSDDDGTLLVRIRPTTKPSVCLQYGVTITVD